MVSPRKRSTAVPRFQAVPASKNSSADDWVSAVNFQFTQSPVPISRKKSRGRVEIPKVNPMTKNRRHSTLLKRLDLPLNSQGSSPGISVRKTRRQSLAVSSRSRVKIDLELSKLDSPKAMKNTRSMIAKLPPRPTAPAKKISPKGSSPKTKSTEETIVKPNEYLSPLKFYNSPTKQKSPLQSASKRKALSESALNKKQSSAKKLKLDVSASKTSSGEDTSPSPILIRNKKLRSSIPTRKSAQTETAKNPANSPKKTRSSTSKSKLSSQKETTSSKPVKELKKVAESSEKKRKSSDKENKAPIQRTGRSNLLESSGKENRSPSEVLESPRKDNKSIHRVGRSNLLDSSRKVDNTPIKQAPRPKSVESPKKPKTPAAKKDATPKSQKTDPVTPKSQKKILKTPGSQEKKSPKQKKALITPKSEKITTPESTSKKERKKTRSSKLVSSPVKKSPQEIKKTPVKASSSKKDVKIRTPVLSVRKSNSDLAKSVCRSTRSSARSSRKVTLIGLSPKSGKTEFRKTPKSNKKTLPSIEQMDDVGASPILSARAQLEVIRARSPMKIKPSNMSSKVKPFTPKPDSPPSRVLRKTMKKKVAQKLQATTKVEVHQLMNGEISQPVRLVSGISTKMATVTVTQSKIVNGHKFTTTVTPRKALPSKTDDIVNVVATTPVSVSNLPPTPTSSRKGELSARRTQSSRTNRVDSSKRNLGSATPRSSTPIEEEGILPLNVDRDSNFADVSINTDESEEESMVSEEKDVSLSQVQSSDEVDQPAPEKSNKRSYCVLM